MPVYKQPNSNNWLIEFMIDGRRYRRSSGTNIKRKAQRIEEMWRQEIHSGKHGIGAAEPLTLGEAVDRYLKTVIQPKHSREKTKKSEGYALDIIVRAFGAQTRIDRIQASDIARWRDRLIAEGRAAATVNRYLALLRAVLNRAHSDWNALQVVPAFRLLPLNNKRHRYLTAGEERGILDVSPPHLRNLIIFLVDTGARLSEALDVTWSDLDLNGTHRSSVTLVRTKNGHPRRIPLTKRSQTMLRDLRANQDNLDQQRVFLYRAPGTSTAVPFRRCDVSWKTALRTADVDPTTRIHDLRHTFASRLVSKGVPIFDVSKLLGHKSITMTMRYAHLAPEAFESAIEKLECGTETDAGGGENSAAFPRSAP